MDGWVLGGGVRGDEAMSGCAGVWGCLIMGLVVAGGTLENALQGLEKVIGVLLP